MQAYRDSTAQIATSSANKEWHQMATIAWRIRNNMCSAEWADKQIPNFTGIFARLLTDPLEDLQKLVEGKWRESI